MDSFIRNALLEDIGAGDHSSNCSIPEDSSGSMILLAKEPGIIAGLPQALRVFELIDPEIAAEIMVGEGQAVKNKDRVCQISGPTRKLLMGERLFLNILQRLCGIATKTHQLCALIEGTHTKLLDTRKTTPNMRFLEKYAVRMGGGENHRMGLYDMIMLKDNHIDFAGGIEAAIAMARNYLAKHQLEIPIEVETRNLDELEQVLATGGVDRVMLDNYTVAETKKGVAMVQGKLETESSGGITESTIRAYAETGVDFISVGALTHSVKSLDLSLKAV